MTARRLPEPPKVELEIASEEKVGDGGFLRIRRVELVARRGDTRSPRFAYDTLDRKALDASVMVVHHKDDDGRVYVWMRTCVRPPLALRPAPPQDPVCWEVPAGLIEPGESPALAAARETEEELGFAVKEQDMKPLGPSMAPAPAFIGELHHYFHVEVDPTTRTEPGGDGSPLESDAIIVAVTLDDALAACRRGEVTDGKTELALRRFADVVEGR